MFRVFNFAAGPAMLPESVLLRAQNELLNWQDTGVSIMEIGHRTSTFQDLLLKLESKLRNLMKIPSNYKILFSSGGAQAHFSLIPMNLTAKNQKADYLISGIWSDRAYKYAARYADVNVVSTGGAHSIPDQSSWSLNSDAAYFYYCHNESVNGVQIHQIPDTGSVPLVVDMTSSILSAPVDVSKYGLIFASAQKNLGIAGVTLIIIRDDLLDQALDIVPEIFNYNTQVANGSLLNTLPTTAIYMMDLVVDWIIDTYRSLDILEAANLRKVNKLYGCIDSSNGFYSNHVENRYRSKINIPFNLPDEDLLKHFLAESSQFGLKYLNGHKLVGGARASLYNAMPEAGVDKLVEFMRHFASKYSN